MMGAIMIRDHLRKPVELILNGEDSSHLSNLRSLLGTSKRLVCMTAFARHSGYQAIQKLLKQRLEEDLEALFVVGLDIFHTDPSVLRHLFDLSKEYGASCKIP
jgi:HKD family nuclease